MNTKKETRDYGHLNMVFKALNSETWTDYLQLDALQHKGELRYIYTI